jgi:hypothetical protein
LFNITAEEVKAIQWKVRQGLVYFALNEKGEKASNPFKASLFGKGAGYSELQSHLQNLRHNCKTAQAGQHSKLPLRKPYWQLKMKLSLKRV